MHCPSWDDAFVSSYRQDAAKRQTAGIVFTRRPKIRFFAPQGRLVESIQVKVAEPTGTWVRLAVQNFTSIGAEGWECGPPKYQKFPLFGKESPCRGDSLGQFRGFYTPNYSTLVFQISCDSLHGLRSYCGEIARL